MNQTSKITRGPASPPPPRIVLAGQEGIGKTTFAAQFPSPLFISSEDGLTGFDHIARITPANLEELASLLDELAIACEYKTIVIDTADWLERLIIQSICARDSSGQKRITNIEDYGYGKGYAIMESELANLLTQLDALRLKHGVGIVILSHVQIRPFHDPRGESWDRYEMKGHKRTSGLLREWPDACLFATYEVFKTSTKDGRERTVGGERVIHTQWSPAWDAKNRLNLPEELPLDYDAFQKAVAENSMQALRNRVRDAVNKAHIPAEKEPQWTAFIKSLDTRPATQLYAALDALVKLTHPEHNNQKTSNQ